MSRPRKHAASTEIRYIEQRLWLDRQKAKPCMDCGGTFHPAAMDFDHRPNEVKLFSIGMGVLRAQDSVRAEIAKCDLVCANCHRVRTYERRVAKAIDSQELK